MQTESWWDSHIHFFEKSWINLAYGEFKAGWYYSDETGCLHGPHATEAEAVAAIKAYAAGLSGDPSDAQ